MGNKPFLLGVIYRKPGSDGDQFIDGFEDLLRSVVLLYPECTITLMGDFNVNLLDMSRGRLPMDYLTLLNTSGFHL